MNKGLQFVERNASRIVWIAITGYVILFTYLCYFSYSNFEYLDMDLASDLTVLWNSLHGRLLYYPLLETNIFGCHLYLFIFFLIPLYGIFPHPVTLLFLHTLFLGIAAWPLFHLARTKLNDKLALVVSIAYLLYPGLGYINLAETHFDSYGVFFLFYSLYYFEKNKFSKFLIATILAMSCKENIALLTVMTGVYALFMKKEMKWVVVPCVMGTVWFLLAVNMVIPYFNSNASAYNQGYMFFYYYRHLGNSFSEIFTTLIMNPQKLFAYRSIGHLYSYCVSVFLPLAFFVLISPLPLLIALPIFLQNILSLQPWHSTIYSHYLTLALPALFYSLIFSFKKISHARISKAFRYSLYGVFISTFIFSCIAFRAPQTYLAKNVFSLKTSAFTKERDKLVAMIPQDAGVVATFKFLPKLSHRSLLYSIHMVGAGKKMYSDAPFSVPETVEYALIDFNEPLLVKKMFSSPRRDNIKNFLQEGNWKVYRAAQDVVLFKKDYLVGIYLFSQIKTRELPSDMQYINYHQAGVLELVGCKIIPGPEAARHLLHIVFYWRCLEQFSNPFPITITLLDKDGVSCHSAAHTLGYNVFSEKSASKENIIKEHYYLWIPPGLKNVGEMSLRISFPYHN